MHGDTVAVVGSGTVGLLLALAAAEAGSAHIVVLALPPTPVGWRLRNSTAPRLSTPMLSTPVITSSSSEEARVADVAFEAAGHPAALQLCIRLIRSHAEVGVIRIADLSVTISTATIIQHEKELVTSRVIPQQPRGRQRFGSENRWRMIQMIRHRIAMAGYQEAFQAARSRGEAKVLFDLR